MEPTPHPLDRSAKGATVLAACQAAASLLANVFQSLELKQGMDHCCEMPDGTRFALSFKCVPAGEGWPASVMPTRVDVPFFNAFVEPEPANTAAQ
jgi:hypothetical protein